MDDDTRGIGVHRGGEGARLPSRQRARVVDRARRGSGGAHLGDGSAPGARDVGVGRGGVLRRVLGGEAAAPRGGLGAYLRPVQEDPAAGLADRAGGARRGKRLVGRGPVHGPARLEEAAGLSAGEALERGAGVPRRPGRGTVRHARRVADHPRAHGPAPGGVELHPRAGIPRHHHPEVLRRPGVSAPTPTRKSSPRSPRAAAPRRSP